MFLIVLQSSSTPNIPLKKEEDNGEDSRENSLEDSAEDSVDEDEKLQLVTISKV